MTDQVDQGGQLGSTLMVFLLGVAVGATVAILYAPASGTETRAQIADKAGHLKERASDLSHQVAERAVEIKDRVVAKVRKSGEPVVDGVDAVAEAAT